MIEETITGAWGTNPIEDGIRINIAVHENHIVFVPFTKDALVQLVEHIAKEGLTSEQRRQLAPLFTGGIVLPGDEDFKPGPQG